MVCNEIERVQTDKVTFLILAYACCINHATWLVKHEALRLMTKVEDLTVPEKVAVLRLLQIETHVDARQTSVHLVDFEHATRLIAARSVVVRKGSAYVEDGQLASVIREAYDSRLMDFVRSCKKRLEEIGQTNTAYYAPQYGTILNVMHDLQIYVCPVVSPEFAGIECSARTLPVAVAQFAPLCIVKLVQKLRVKRHLIDKERVTLRLWLRAVKVKLDVAVEFWSQNVPEKEDVRGPIAQAYAKQYKCVGCAKIAAQGLCPFHDPENAMLAWCGDTVPSVLPDMEDIMKKTASPFNRCGSVFSLRYGGTLGGPRNPANYFALASEARLPQSS
jgi:DNA primase large subunit